MQNSLKLFFISCGFILIALFILGYQFMMSNFNITIDFVFSLCLVFAILFWLLSFVEREGERK